MSRDAVIGAGSWGTALALHLARAGRPVALWARRPASAAVLRERRENPAYLPGHPLPEAIEVTDDLGAALRGAALVIFAVPAQMSRPVFQAVAPHLEATADPVIASKGVEETTLLRLSEVFTAAAGTSAGARVSVLSGPSFAAEVARGDPTAVVVAGRDGASVERVQRAVSHGSLRAYRNADLVGVEIAGAVKNVVAIATGIAEGLGFGNNTRAALITRGMAEIARLGTALGGEAATFAGLAGAGDLILTCTGSLSRNRAVGVGIGRGRTVPEILAELRMVAEGVATTRAVVALAARHGVDMPIATKVHDVLFEGRPPHDAVVDLLARPLREEA